MSNPVNELIEATENDEKTPGDAIYSFKNRDELIKYYNQNRQNCIDLFHSKISLCSISKQTFFLEGVVNYIFELTSASNSNGNTSFVFFTDLNKRKRNDGGFGGFGQMMYEYQDILVDFVKSNLDCFNKSKIKIRKIISSNLLVNRTLSDNRNMGYRIHFLTKQKIKYTDIEFVPHHNFITIENGFSFIFGDDMFGNTLPYFSKNLFPIVSYFSPLQIEITQPNSDFFINEIVNHFHYVNIKPFKLILDYERDSYSNFDPLIMINDNSEDNKIWSISTPLGECFYSYNINNEAVTISVVLYMKNILHIAAKKKIDPYCLLLVTYIHELSHYVYFSGQFSFGRPFYPFDNRQFDFSKFGLEDFHEAFAQYSTYLCVKEDEQLLSCFLAINKNQSKNYQSWKKMKTLSSFEIGKRLMLANDNIIVKTFGNFFIK